MGFTADDYDETVELWPENWPAWQLFCRVATQWRTAPMGGYLGLDHGPLIALLNRENLSPDDWDERFDDVRVLEAAALSKLNTKVP